jgi:hypothetical protein
VPTKQEYDPIIKLISNIFLCDESQSYNHCGVGLRESGQLDFFWNFRVVDTIVVENRILDGYIIDVDADFGFVYYTKITFKGAKEIMTQLSDKNSYLY